jgi:hypothetical protein
MATSDITRLPVANAGPEAQSEVESITIVTGLPRSGTSMMMQMLVAGGCRALVDDRRSADPNNPRGYYEYEPVTRLHLNSRWLPEARGRILKVVAPLLRHLPGSGADGLPLRYRVIFMRREVCQVVASQLRMLRNLGRENEAPAEAILLAAMQQELVVADQWIAHHAESVIDIDYLATRQFPSATDERLAAFLPGLDAKQAGLAVVPHALFIRRHPLICGTPK